MPPGTGVRTVFEQACAARDLRPEIGLQAGAADAIADLAVRGLGVAILTVSMAAQYAGRLIARDIHDAGAPALLALVWKGGSEPAVREFLRYGRRAFGGQGNGGQGNGEG